MAGGARLWSSLLASMVLLTGCLGGNDSTPDSNEPVPGVDLPELLPLLGEVETDDSSGSPIVQDWLRVRDPRFDQGREDLYIEDLDAPAGNMPWRATGYTMDANGVRTPVVWSSPDLESWTRETIVPSTPGARRDRLFGLAQRDGIAVTIGDQTKGQFKDAPTTWRSEGSEAWQSLRMDNISLDLHSGRMLGITAASDVFMAVGGRIDAWGAHRVAVWTSRDGVSWEVDDDPALVADPGERLWAYNAAANGNTTVIVGDGFTDLAPDEADGQIWFSDRGSSWQRVSAVEAKLGGPGQQQVSDVVPFGTGFVAVGVSEELGNPTATAWYSREGEHWERVPSGAFVPPDLPLASSVTGVAADGHRVYAFGEVGDMPALWTSSDGKSWRPERVPNEFGSLGETDGGVSVAAADGKIAVAFNGHGWSSLWVRHRGNWSDALAGSPAFPSPTAEVSILDVAFHEGTFVAAGGSFTPNASDARAVLWRSDTGIDWEPIPDPDPLPRGLSSLIASDQGFVAGGSAVAHGLPVPVIWRSEDGLSWTSSRLGSSRGPGAIYGAAAGVVELTDSLLAVVNEVDRVDASIGLWRSRDGDAWTRLSTLGREGTVATGVCAGPSGILVLGRSGEAAVVWHHREGAPWEEVMNDATVRFSDCAVGPVGQVVVGERGSSAVAWNRSAEGSLSEAQIVTGTPNQTRVFGQVVARGSGFIAVGGEAHDEQEDLVVWTAPDGSTWSPLSGSPVFSELGYQSGQAIAFGEGIAVIGGWHETGAGMWATPASAIDRHLFS